MSSRHGCPSRAALGLLVVLAAAGAAPPDRTLPPRVDPGQPLRAPPCEELRLANGIRLLVVERHAVPSVHLVWSVNAGSAEDPPGLPGTAALLARALLHEPRWAGESLAERLRGRGVLLDADVDQDSTRFSVQAPAGRLRWAARLLGRALSRPPAGIDDARSVALEELARRCGDPERRFVAAAWNSVYGANHTYGRPVQGTEESLHAIEADDLRRFHERHFDPERMLVAVAGDLDTVRLRRELERFASPFTGELSASGREPPPAPPRDGGPRIVLLDRPGSTRATVGLAARLPGQLVPLDPAARVTAHLLGGPGHSRLLGALRGELGFAYDARSWIESRQEGGLFLARSVVAAEDAVPALRRLLAEVEALRREPPDQELRLARISLASGLLAGWFETNRSSARAWASLALLGVDRGGLDERLHEVESLGGAATSRFAGEHLRRERLVLLVIGDGARLLGPLGELGHGAVELWETGRSPAANDDVSPAGGR